MSATPGRIPNGQAAEAPVRTPRPAPAAPLRLLANPAAVVDGGFHRTRAFRVRLAVLGAVAVIAFGVLVLRLVSLQVVHGPELRAAAHAQAVRTVDLPTPRGAILDRRGRVLVDSAARLALAIEPGRLGKLDETGRWLPSRRGRAVLRRLARATGTPVARLLAAARRSQLRQPFAPAVVLRDVSPRLAALVEEHADRFPGVRVESLPERTYPHGSLGASFLGLLGEITPEQLREPRFRGRRPGDWVGQSGLEAVYDRPLGGRPLRMSVPVDALGRVVGEPAIAERPAGRRSLQLTIDLDVQRAAERALARGIALARANGHEDASEGAAVVMDARTGALLALASYPSFDQARAGSNARYLRSLLDPENGARPLVNRATQGLFPPGSTFKPIVAQAALAAGLITPSTRLPCPSSLQIGDSVFGNAGAGTHGSLDLRGALKVSCNTWFYRLGLRFHELEQQGRRREAIQRLAQRLGLGRATGIDLPGEAAGVVPTRAWLRANFKVGGRPGWYPGDAANLAIGQGYLAVTPLELAVAYAALANGGTVVRPRLASALLDDDGRVVRRLRFPPRTRLRLEHAGVIREALYAATHEPGGTSAAIFGSFPLPVAGKTGTAEAPPGSDHSWFASFAPAHEPRVVVVVLVAHGGFGSEAAAPAAKEIYRALLRTPWGREHLHRDEGGGDVRDRA